MKTEICKVIKAPAERVWATIAEGGDVHRWFSRVITACDLSGTGDGATRRCVMADGSALQERILEVDHHRKHFRYAIDKHPLPASDVVATITVEAMPNGTTQVAWGAEYTVTEEHAQMVQRTLGDLYAQGIDSLEAYHATPSQGK